MAGSVFNGTVRPRTRSELLAAGVTPAQLRGPRWQRTSQNLYLPAAVDPSACAQRIVSAAFRLPLGGAVGGWAAAWAHGVSECDGLGLDGSTMLAVPLCCGGRHIRRVDGVDVWYDPLSADDVVLIDGVPVTVPGRTCIDRMRRAPTLREAVAVADQMTHAGVVDPAGLTALLDTYRGWRGIEQARRAAVLCDPMARNSWETRLRMVWVLDAGLPPPLCNPPVFDLFEGLLGYPDLLDAEAGVVFEYDGSGHRGRHQHDRDNIREERFEEHGLVVARVSGAQLADRRALAERMVRTRRRGLARDRRRDSWTLAIPPSWGAYGFAGRIGPLLDALHPL